VTEDPKRIVEGASGLRLASLLRAANEDGLAPEQVERLRAAVASAVAAGGVTLAAGSAKTAGAQLGSKLLAAWAVRGAVAALVVSAGIGSALVIRAESRSASRQPLPVSPPPLVATATAAPPVPDRANDLQDTASPSAAQSGLPQAPPTPGAVIPAANAQSGDGTPRGAPNSGLGGSSTASPARAFASQLVASSPAPPSTEGTLLLEARRVLGRDPARALELVRQHERAYPASQLSPERERIASEARKLLESPPSP
jgi:hypothetical protein